MATLKRGANVALTREIPNLTGVVLGVRFNPGAEQIVADNLVVATILCDASGKALSDEHFVFFNQLASPDFSVRQLEEVLGRDTEQIEIDLDQVPTQIARIVIVVYLNEGTAKRRSLGQAPRFRRVAGRVVRYRAGAVAEWLDSQDEIGGK